MASSREEAIEELVDHLVAAGRLGGEARGEVLAALKEREDRLSTGIGSGVAIPHAFSNCADDVVAIFGRSEAGIDFESTDNLPVHYIVLFVVPKKQYLLHLRTLAAIAKLFIPTAGCANGSRSRPTARRSKRSLHRARLALSLPRKMVGGFPTILKTLHPMSETTLKPFPEQIASALRAVLQPMGAPGDFVPQVTPATDARFGDYQTNAAMMLSKALKRNPREIAAQIVDGIDGGDLFGEPDIAGPGFINFKLDDAAYGVRLRALLGDPKLGVPAASQPKKIVIDFSAPNVAKPMHVGHIRSTIIGDCLARTARFLGHEVVSDNHIGDWGTQFGMVIYGWKNLLDETALEADPVGELLRIYREVNQRQKEDDSLRDLCKAELVKLQSGDEDNLAIWERCVAMSKRGLQKIYDRLDIEFDCWLGESFYNDALKPLVADLLEMGIARESDGAVAGFLRWLGPMRKTIRS